MRSDVHRLAVMLAAFVGGLALFVAGFVIVLEVRSVVATPTSAPMAQLPNPGHGWSEIGDLPGTMWHSNNDGTGSGLDADTVDGLQSTEIHDADDYVSNAGHANTADGATTATSAAYATSAGDADTLDGLNSDEIQDADDYVSNAGYASNASNASNADTLDGYHYNQIHDADNYVSSAGNADTVDGLHASQIHDADDYVSSAGYAATAGDADTLDGVHASELLGQGDIAIGMGSIAHGAQIPLPQFGDGSTASQSSSVWMVSLRRSIDVDWGRHEEAITCIDCYADANRNVLCRTYHPDKGGWKAATANYIIVGRR